MKRKAKLIIFAALAATRFSAAPAFGQAFGTGLWTGNVPPSYSNSIVPGIVSHRAHGRMARQSGLNSYAMQPRPQSDFNSDSPATTGGGSVGYNENLYNY